MFTYQLKTAVADKIDAMLKSGKAIGHLKSGDGINFFLNSAISHVQTGSKRIVDFDIPQFNQMIAYNKQEIARTNDADDKAVLTALNEVLSGIAQPVRKKKEQAARTEDNDDYIDEKDDDLDIEIDHQPAKKPESKKPASKKGQSKGPVPVSIVDETSLTAAEKTMWAAWQTMNAALPTEGGAIEHYTRLSFHDALKLDPEQLYRSCNKLMDAIAGSGRAAQLYDLLHTMQDKHIDVLQEAMTTKANDNMVEKVTKPKASSSRSR